jgi:hypothetical protein
MQREVRLVYAVILFCVASVVFVGVFFSLCNIMKVISELRSDLFCVCVSLVRILQNPPLQQDISFPSQLNNKSGNLPLRSLLSHGTITINLPCQIKSH